MANVMFRLMMFGIFLNLATGVMMNFVLDNAGHPIFVQGQTTAGVNYSANYTYQFNSSMSKILQPTATAQDQSTWVFRFLDLIGLGIIKDILVLIDTYMFGFINFIMQITSVFFGPGYTPGIGLILKTMNTIIYLICGYQMWKGRDVTE